MSAYCKIILCAILGLMRTWTPPKWIGEQLEGGAISKGSAKLKNYGSSSKGSSWVEIIWRKTYEKNDQEGKDIMFRLVDKERDVEYIFDREELAAWTRWA